MTIKEHLLCCLMEECGELVQATSKGLRFGLNDKYKEYETPRIRVVEEFNHVLAVMELIQEEESMGVLPISRSRIEEKKEKVKKYIKYAKEKGTIV